MALQFRLVLLCLSLVLVDVEFKAHLLLIELSSVAIVLSFVVLHINRKLALFDIKSARVYPLLTLIYELNLRSGPVSQHVVCFIE